MGDLFSLIANVFYPTYKERAELKRDMHVSLITKGEWV